MAESDDEKKIGDENEAAGLNRDGSPKDDGSKKAAGRKPAVTFNADQIKVINEMLEARMKNVRSSSENPNNPISMYNLRDPKNIETVKVARFPGTKGTVKWVVGFKDQQNDPFKKTPKYLRYGVDTIRKLNNEPYVTLILSEDGEKEEEREVLLVDYMENRERIDVKVLNVRIEEVINDHGILGQQNNFAVAVDDKGRPESRPTILAQSKSVIRFFTVQPEGFTEPREYPTDFLG